MRLDWQRATLLAGAVVVALGFDSLDRAQPYDTVRTGLLDEPAHLAFGALFLLAAAGVARLDRRFVIAALVASVAIDLDHLPRYLGVDDLSATPGGRPYTHSLATAAGVVVIAAVVRRWRPAAVGAACGLVVHLLRDICEGSPGVSLFWPISGHVVVGTRDDFRLAVIAMAAMACVGIFRARG